MSLNLNRVTVAGNLTRDPETKFLANSKAVASFGLAINRRWKDNDGQPKEETTFVDIEAWGRTAELCGQYLAKGRNVYIEGRLKLESWDDRNTGQKRSKLKIVADAVQFIGGKSDGESAGAPAQASTSAAPRRPAAAPAQPAGDDEPPF